MLKTVSKEGTIYLPDIFLNLLDNPKSVRIGYSNKTIFLSPEKIKEGVFDLYDIQPVYRNRIKIPEDLIFMMYLKGGDKVSIAVLNTFSFGNCIKIVKI